MKIKTGVIGFGFIGSVHAKNILESGDMELCAIIENKSGDIFSALPAGNLGSQNIPIEQLRSVPVFKSLDECLCKVSLQAVVIAVPLFMHYKTAKEALQKGLHVFLEKPFCSTVSECGELIDLSVRQKLLLMIGHVIRFDSAWSYLAQSIKNGRYGALKYLSLTRITGEPDWGAWNRPEKKQIYGRALIDLLIHDIDFALYCLGEPSEIRCNEHHDEYWDLTFVYKDSDLHVNVRGGFLYPHTVFSSDFAADFSDGSLRYSTWQGQTIYSADSKGVQYLPVNGNGYVNELSYFADCITHGNQPDKCMPKDSLRVIEVIEKIAGN